ncbi:MAG: electron transfer flavoprotein subunit beta/FixA family protein [Actinomycetota bacterium]|jgi:electron transfer flavoprotein beta subunit|nr:electron transfer flavoprotein subunit beta/FixA family protein [Actinomycetota bacterium]
MNVVVCVKQIPDPAATQSLDAEHRLSRVGKLILDEADTYGVEVALRLVEGRGEGEVSLVSMGDATDVTGIRSALAMGAVRATVVSDPLLKGADALSTAKVLAAVISRATPDLVLCATESSDGYTGTLPVQLAQLLDWPALTFATSVVIEDDTVVVHRQTEAGFDEVAAHLPAVVTVTAGVVEPRYATFKGIMAAKSRPVDVVTIADLGLDPADLDPRQDIVAVETASTKNAGEKYVDDGEGAARIVAFLEQIKIVSGGVS